VADGELPDLIEAMKSRRYVVTSLEGSAQHLYEAVYCQRRQMENLTVEVFGRHP
jgi:hypothetical protein